MSKHLVEVEDDGHVLNESCVILSGRRHNVESGGRSEVTNQAHLHFGVWIDLFLSQALEGAYQHEHAGHEHRWAHSHQGHLLSSDGEVCIFKFKRHIVNVHKCNSEVSRFQSILYCLPVFGTVENDCFALRA